MESLWVIVRKMPSADHMSTLSRGFPLAILGITFVCCTCAFSQGIKVGAMLQDNFELPRDCSDMPPHVISTLTTSEGNITLNTLWISLNCVFQKISYVNSSRGENFQFDILLIDDSMKSLDALLTQNRDWRVVPLPKMFWLKDTTVHLTVIDTDLGCCEDWEESDECYIKHYKNVTLMCLSSPSAAPVLSIVIGHLNWNELVVIHDDINELTVTSMAVALGGIELILYKLVSDDPESTNDTIKVSTATDTNRISSKIDTGIRNLLTTLYDNTPMERNINVLLLCSVQNMKRVLTLANQFDLEHGKGVAMHYRSRWLISLLGFSNDDTAELAGFLQDKERLDNVAVVHRTGPIPDHRKNSMRVQELMKEAISRVERHNLTLTAATLELALNNIIQTASQECQETVVSTLYFGEKRVRYLNSVAMVTLSQGLVFLGEHDVFPNTLFALNKRTLTVAVAEWTPFVMKIEKGNRTEYEGFCMDLLRQMELVLNFTAELVEPNDGQWGNKRPDGTFTGLIGQLQRKEVELVVAPLAMHEEREAVMDFSYPYYTDHSTVLLKMPDPDEAKWLTLIRPFKGEVHLVIWICMFFVAILATLLERNNPYYRAKNLKSGLHSLYESVWYMYGSLLTQGGERLPASTTGRTLLSFWWLFTIIVASTYSGNLIAFLTVTKDTLPFDSLYDMLQQSRYKFGTVGGTIVQIYFENAKDPTKIAIWEKIKRFNKSDPSVLSPSLDVHLEKVKKGDYAFIGDNSLIDFWKNRECNLMAIKEKFYPVQYSVGLVNHSAYKKIVSEEMIKIAELGLFHTWGSNWWAKERFCQGSLITEAKAITVLDVQSAFYMLIVGIVLSAIVLGLEKLRRYIATRRASKKYSPGNAVMIHNDLARSDHEEAFCERFQMETTETTLNCNLLTTDSLKRHNLNRNTYSDDKESVSQNLAYSDDPEDRLKENIFTVDLIYSRNTHNSNSVYDNEGQKDNQGFTHSQNVHRKAKATNHRHEAKRNKNTTPFYLSRISLPETFQTERKNSV